MQEATTKQFIIHMWGESNSLQSKFSKQDSPTSDVKEDTKWLSGFKCNFIVKYVIWLILYIGGPCRKDINKD